jgi:hypothetical protein
MSADTIRLSVAGRRYPQLYPPGLRGRTTISTLWRPSPVALASPYPQPARAGADARSTRSVRLCQKASAPGVTLFLADRCWRAGPSLGLNSKKSQNPRKKSCEFIRLKPNCTLCPFRLEAGMSRGPGWLQQYLLYVVGQSNRAGMELTFAEIRAIAKPHEQTYRPHAERSLRRGVAETRGCTGYRGARPGRYSAANGVICVSRECVTGGRC